MRCWKNRAIAFGTVVGAVLLVAMIPGVEPVLSAEEVVVYSARKEHLIKPVLDVYTRQTGVQIRILTDQAGPLLLRLKAEGRHTPADLLVTVDAGNLWKAAEEGVLQPVQSAVLSARIPSHLRDPDHRWFGLSIRARTIVYNSRKVRPSELSTYEDLGSPRWKKRLCLRTSKKVYNQSLIAMTLARLGWDRTEQMVQSWVGNLATEVLSDDTRVMKAIAAGQCDVGIVNSYYYVRLKERSPDLPLALYWANQEGQGVHVNISGAGIVRHAKHPQAALRLLEWLSSEEAQNLFADVNFEFPVNPVVSPHAKVQTLGSFTQDLINVSQAGALQKDAIKLMDRAGYK